MSRPDGSFVCGFLSSVSLLLFVSYRSQQEGEVFCVQMFLLLVPRCYGAQQEGEVLIDMVRDCSFRLHTLLFPVPYASWTFRPVPRLSSLYSQYTRFSPSLSQHKSICLFVRLKSGYHGHSSCSRADGWIEFGMSSFERIVSYCTIDLAYNISSCPPF